MPNKFIDIDPRLSDFSQEELRDCAVAVSIYIEDLQNHIKSLAQSPELQAMFSDKLIEYTERVNNLQTVYTQLVNANARKEVEKRVASN